jgi:enamine deaminase RidA (YjgF/YER057c/UK114 family)
MPSARDAVFPEGRHALYAIHRYSAAVSSNGFVFVSGQVGSRDDGTPEPQLEDQVRRAFTNLVATLKAAGCGLDDIVDVSTFHTNPEAQLDTVLRVKDEFFPTAPYPTWTAVGVTWLAGFDFEIKVVAKLP